MFKKELGISIYPEHFSLEEIKTYLEKCKKNNMTKIFFSLIHLGKVPDEKLIQKYQEVFLMAKEMGYYNVLDVIEETFPIFGFKTDEVYKFKTLGIDCLRLDSPLLPKIVADLSYRNIDLQINISNNDNFITNILDFKPKLENLYGCHNFYPLKNSALALDAFLESSKRFVDLGIHTSAFVGSLQALKGPQKYDVPQLVSLEIIRNLPIRSQAKYLFKTNLVSSVYVGNQAMSDEEIVEFGGTLTIDKFEFDIHLNDDLLPIEQEIINYQNHFWRGDVSGDFVRSTYPRVDVEGEVTPNHIKQSLNYGDLCIVNSNNKHYQKELIIILQDNYKELKDTVNFIGHIKSYDLPLLKLMRGWDRFSFRNTK
ncbi:hypothetical protein JN01_0621 [Entomoplasma freundtii]|uniref:Uncharacterized protein n=1 Tax=Entomoplasma freundtii TaxID=74700 RepID=A0A2K8NR91_9MOLU|nr:MupG family TIM beta-alpha barrel fold protein [Entomoplasma freundtii]ATZ16339.1 hypothetical protein EFREU_v1c03130 [Entomoplasma freundtii]TDY56622.1 hypothetical protein JN01_0621 [Entomoplasma freundtii]